MHLAAMQFNSSYEVTEEDKAEGFMHTRGQEGGVIDFTSSYSVVGPKQRNDFSQIKTIRKVYPNSAFSRTPIKSFFKA